MSDENPGRDYRDPEYLQDQYVDRRRSARQIAEDCGVSPSTIHRWLDRLDIDRQPRYRDADWLADQYVSRNRSQQAIAADCDVSPSTICHWLARHGITEGEAFETADCATCGEAFRYYPSVREGTYCSNECANEPRKRQVTVTCTGCGEPFQRWLLWRLSIARCPVGVKMSRPSRTGRSYTAGSGTDSVAEHSAVTTTSVLSVVSAMRSTDVDSVAV